MESEFEIVIAVTGEQIVRCFPVMAVLRPHLAESEFLSTVRRLQGEGYELVYLEAAGQVRSVAGYRLQESLARGRFLYLDDFVTAAADRQKGFASALFEWLVARARSLECVSLQLDSGPTRHEAHRFYEARGMAESSRHYSIPIS